MSKVKKRGTKKDAPGDTPVAELPAVLAPGGTVEARLDAAEQEGRDDRCQLVAAALREALAALRGVCEAAVRGRSLEDARRDRVCADALADMRSPPGGRATLLRLVVILNLTDEPPDELWKAGVAAYREDRAVYDVVLGDVLPKSVRWEGTHLDYRDNANPTAAGDWKMFTSLLHQQRKALRPGLATGLPALDARTGGLYGLTLLAGEPASGKTSLALQIAAGAVRTDPSVAALYVELEMGKHPLYLRLLSQESGVPLPRIATDPTPGDETASRDAGKRLQTEVLPRLRVVDLTTARRVTPLTRRWFKGEIDRLLAIDGVDRCLVVVDSINLMGVEDAVLSHGDDGPTRYQRPSELDALKARMEVLLDVQQMTRAIAGPAGFPVLAVARCRKPDRRGSLELADLYGGADLGYDAQSVYLLGRQDAADPAVTPVTLKLAKVREWGCEGEIELDFHHTVSTFRPRTLPAAPAADRPAAKARFGGRS